MGMPKVIMEFTQKAISAIRRSSKGVVGLILKDNTKTFESITYASFADVKKEDWKGINYKIIERTFIGLPKKVIVVRISEGQEVKSEALGRLISKRVDYLAFPEATGTEKTALTSFYLGKKTEEIKLVLVDADTADNEKVINVKMGYIGKNDELVTKEEFSARLSGILAGLSQETSSTFYEIAEAVDLIDEEIPDDYDVAIDNGHLVLVNDGEKIKIARGVNSLKTLTETKGASFKKIKIVEAMGLMRRDIRDTWENNYAGKVINSYMNKIMFLGAVKVYFQEVAKVGMLDSSFNNTIEIDMKEQINYLKTGAGLSEDEIAEMEEKDIRSYNTGSSLFAKATVKYADTMEDLFLPISL